METILEMKKITKIFPGVRALDEVDFDLRKGEIQALIGENGAGKSTLMKALLGMYEIDGGEILSLIHIYYSLDDLRTRHADLAG